MSASQPIEWTVAQLAQAVERGQLEAALPADCRFAQ